MTTPGAHTLILGLGNPIRGDDAAGLLAAEAVRARLPAGARARVELEERGGLPLVERLAGCEHAILLDAICTGAWPPGTVLRLRADGLTARQSASLHGLDLATALAFAAAARLALPAEIVVLAIEIPPAEAFAAELTPAVAAGVEALVQAVLAELERPAVPGGSPA
jgi:hydrogenase maturation protease